MLSQHPACRRRGERRRRNGAGARRGLRGAGRWRLQRIAPVPEQRHVALARQPVTCRRARARVYKYATLPPWAFGKRKEVPGGKG